MEAASCYLWRFLAALGVGVYGLMMIIKQIVMIRRMVTMASPSKTQGLEINKFRNIEKLNAYNTNNNNNNNSKTLINSSYSHALMSNERG